jgi:type IV secretory pathway VirD2 relaxase
MAKAHIVRRTRSSSNHTLLTRHAAYLKRDGVTHDGTDARMFDARSDVADEQAFAERCRDDRHHFRFIVSPEDAAELESLGTFARELMADAERVSAPSSIGSASTTGTRTTRMSISSSADARTTARIW